MISKWQGQSEKLVRQLFVLAQKMAPSIVFIDEIDSMCCARNDRDSETARRIKTEFLVQLQGLTKQTSNGNKKHVLVLAATNLPWELDSAVRRRFEKRIYVGLPNKSARIDMIKACIGKTPHELSEQDFDELGESTEGFSGSDITVVVRNALMAPIRKITAAMNNAIESKQENTTTNFPAPVVKSDFTIGNSSVSKQDLEVYVQFEKLYGTN